MPTEAEEAFAVIREIRSVIDRSTLMDRWQLSAALMHVLDSTDIGAICGRREATPMPSQAPVTTGSMRYYCADGRRIAEGHDTEECAPCLRAQRDGIRRQYEATVNVDLVERLREMDRRVAKQRDELARLNEAVAKPASSVTAWDAYTAWVSPKLERGDRRLASCAFRAGWAAARRAISLPEEASDGPSQACGRCGQPDTADAATCETTWCRAFREGKAEGVIEAIAWRDSGAGPSSGHAGPVATLREQARQWCESGVEGYVDGYKVRRDCSPDVLVDSLTELLSKVQADGKRQAQRKVVDLWDEFAFEKGDAFAKIMSEYVEEWRAAEFTSPGQRAVAPLLAIVDELDGAAPVSGSAKGGE